jgi:hypothetical protein
LGWPPSRRPACPVIRPALRLCPGLLLTSKKLADAGKDVEHGLLAGLRAGGQAGSPHGVGLGRNFHFGIREHGMGAVCNGIPYHGGLCPYCGTFLVFSDYMRPAIHVAALSRLPTIRVFSHDSIFVGADGPPNEPVVHLAALCTIPNLLVMRPADAEETTEVWLMAYERYKGLRPCASPGRTCPCWPRPTPTGARLSAGGPARPWTARASGAGGGLKQRGARGLGRGRRAEGPPHPGPVYALPRTVVAQDAASCLAIAPFAANLFQSARRACRRDSRRPTCSLEIANSTVPSASTARNLRSYGR